MVSGGATQKAFVTLVCCIFCIFHRVSSVTEYQASLQVLESILKNDTIDLSYSCLQSLMVVKQTLKFDNESWPLLMTTSILYNRPPDIRRGIGANFGSFDSCLSIETTNFTGKYCLYRTHFNLSDSSVQRSLASKPNGYSDFLRFETSAGSICLPSTCSDSDVLQVTRLFVAERGRSLVEIRSTECQIRYSESEIKRESRQEFPFQIILVLWLLFIVASSLKTNFTKTDKGSIWRCFSIQHIVRDLLKESSNSEEYICYHYFRFCFLTMATGIHIFHLSMLWAPLSIINLANYKSPYNLHTRTFFTHFSIGMGFNLVWSGFLSFKGRLKELEKSCHFNYTKALVNRVLRTLPTSLACYLLILAYPRRWSSGPLFKESFNHIRRNCQKNYWTELTFLQNTVHPRDMCFMPSWILSVDLHLYLLTFPVIWLYYRNPTIGKYSITSVMIWGAVIHGVYAFWNHGNAVLSYANFDIASMVNHMGLHTGTINYVSSYFAGILGAIAFHERRRLKYMTKICVTISLVLIECIIQWAMTMENRTLGQYEAGAYQASSRLLSGIAAAIGTFCLVSINGTLQRLLAFRILQIFSRFNYSVYMASFLVFYFEVFTLRAPLEYHVHSFVTHWLVVMVEGIVLGLFLHVFFEAPFIRVSRYLFTSDPDVSPSSSPPPGVQTPDSGLSLSSSASSSPSIPSTPLSLSPTPVKDLSITPKGYRKLQRKTLNNNCLEKLE